jgi:hypothetical protein
MATSKRTKGKSRQIAARSHAHKTVAERGQELTEKPAEPSGSRISSPRISKEKTDMADESTSSKGNASPAAAAPTQASIRYLDQADMAETFADSITGLIFDGQTLRIEFGVTRFDEVKPNSPITGRRYPACRLVLPPAAAVELINRMQQIAAALAQAGVVKAAPRGTTAEPAKS